MEAGNVIFLNGTSSSGKTSIAKTLQEILDGYYIHTGIDHFLERLPEKFFVMYRGTNPPPAEGVVWVFADGDEQVTEIRTGPASDRFRLGIFHAVAGLATAGNNVIVDDVVVDVTVLKEAANILQDFNVLFVGVRCPLDVAEQRERERGDRSPGLVRMHYDQVHAHGTYDVEVDTSVLTTMECALQIKYRLMHGPPPDAFQRLREIHETR